MRKKKLLYRILLLAGYFITVITNLSGFIFGNTATPVDFVASFIYSVVWIILFIYALKLKERNLLLFSNVYWTFTLITAVIILFVNICDFNADWIIMFAFAFITPLRGLQFLGQDVLIALALIIITSCCYLLLGIKAYFGKRDEMHIT